MSITVNGVEISDAALHAEMQHHPAPSREMAEHSARLALVARELLLQEAARLNITDADEEERLNTLLERQAQTPEPDEDGCQRFFAANRPRFRTSDLFEVSHILCAAPPDDDEARTTARLRIEEALAQLAQGTAFAELAAQISDCPSKEQGGNLGQIAMAQTVPEFEQVMVSMQEGETSAQPVESRFGFHILHLHNKIAGHPLDYPQVRERIASYLRESGQRQAISQYLASLMKNADIQGMELPDSSLVQ
ncbi:MAG: peptidyl-prolyl cis-trans isomerase [Pseudomonadota bacterium]|nr:peptidyl-prolyl cis-trans isomerase [Pseudomonadota bacterium]